MELPTNRSTAFYARVPYVKRKMIQGKFSTSIITSLLSSINPKDTIDCQDKIVFECRSRVAEPFRADPRTWLQREHSYIRRGRKFKAPKRPHRKNQVFPMPLNSYPQSSGLEDNTRII
jgi:hypothetical protein